MGVAITAYPTVVRDGENYISAMAVGNRGPLHLEGRYNYESVGARSVFVGWTFLWRSTSRGNWGDQQRGPFAQVTLGPFTTGGYWFNPASDAQVFVGSIGATF